MLERNMSSDTIVMSNGQDRKEVKIASLEQDRLITEGWKILKRRKPGRRSSNGNIQD
jgi:hypothetical protein